MIIKSTTWVFPARRQAGSKPLNTNFIIMKHPYLKKHKHNDNKISNMGVPSFLVKIILL